MNPPALPRVTLVTSNGWGLGHLSRQLAIALALGDEADVTMFSFSRGLPLVGQFDIQGEYCLSYTSPWIPRSRWNAYVEARFLAFLDEVSPDIVLFDGVAPYIGIINALRKHPEISAGWLRRGMWLRGRSEAQLEKTAEFDFVIEPGDIASEADRGPTARLDAIRVPPVSLLEVVPLLDREDAAAELGLDPGKPSLLFSLTSGQPGEAMDAGRAALTRALQYHSWQVGQVNSPLSDSGSTGETDSTQLRGVYPLMRYLRAFDAAVTAAGYNSVHELIPAHIPSLVVPKSASQTDNQIARASFLAERRLALMAADNDIEGVRRGVDDLLGGQREVIARELARAPQPSMMGGARAVAEIITTSPPRGLRESGIEEWRQPGFKGFVKRAIGPSGVALVKRALGRVPEAPARSQVALNGVPRDEVSRLHFTGDLDVVAQYPDQPVEHILQGASASYRDSRRDLIDEFYEIVD